MKKLLIHVLLVLTLCGCETTNDSVNDISTSENTSAISDNSENELADCNISENIANSASSSDYTRDSATIEASWEARLDVSQDNLEKIPDVCTNLVTDEIKQYNDTDVLGVYICNLCVSGEEYSNLANSISVVVNETEEEFLSDIDEIYDEKVSSMNEENSDFIETYNLCYECMRADNRVLSFKQINSITNSIRLYNYDVVTGEQLAFGDILIDEEIFWEVVTPMIKEQLGNYINCSYSNTYINSMSHNTEDWYWYMDASGIYIGFYEDGRYHVALPYYDIADLIKPQYLPGMGTMWGEISCNTRIEVQDGVQICLDGVTTNINDEVRININNEDVFVIDEETLLLFNQDPSAYEWTESYIAQAELLKREDGNVYIKFLVLGYLDGVGLSLLYQVTNDGEFILVNDDVPSIFYNMDNGPIFDGFAYRWDSTEEW